jgi:Ca2+-binding RTX toxin-like protein
MTKRIFIITLIILGVIVAAVARALVNPADFNTYASVGDLTTDWGGVQAPNAMFFVTGMLPGDSVTKTLTVTNTGTSIKPLGIRAVQTSLTGQPDFPAQLLLRILENGTEIRSYSLAGLFNESLNNGYVDFADLAPGATGKYEFQVTFDPDAGNPYQKNSVVFNLILGIAIEVPDECQRILTEPNVKFIFGTDKKETLTGGNYPNVIFGFGGDDMLNGNNLQDCLIGGDGNDKLHGNNKNDVLLGGAGDDDLNGNNGDDYLDGGPGENKVDGSNGTDTCKNGTRVRCEL